MLGNNRGRDYDVYERGERVLSVRYLTPTEPSDCCMCGRSTFDHFAVPYYCGPVRSGKSEGGYAPACRRCYDRWARWDDAMEEYDSWLSVLRAQASRPVCGNCDTAVPPGAAASSRATASTARSTVPMAWTCLMEHSDEQPHARPARSRA